MNTLWLTIVDAQLHPIPNATVLASTLTEQLNLETMAGGWVGCGPARAQVRLRASAPGFEPETHTLLLRDVLTPVILGLRRTGEVAYTYGLHRLAFAPMSDEFLVHVWGNNAGEAFAHFATKLGLTWQPVLPQAAPTSHELFLRVAAPLEKGYALAKELRCQCLRVALARVVPHGVVMMR